MKYILILVVVWCVSPVVLWGQNIGLGTTVPLTSVHMHDPNSNHTKVLISSVAINDSASLFLTEDLNGVFGMGWLYDGIGNYMHLYGHSNLDYLGPHISVQRDEPTRVGIDVTNPTETLHIGGGLRLGDAIAMGAGTIRWTGTDFEGYDGSSWNSFTLGGKWSEQGGMPDNIYYNTGHVGIGTSTPNNPLDIISLTSPVVAEVSGAYTGANAQTGVNVYVVNEGSGDKYGVATQVGNIFESPNNTLYGMYSTISSLASGTHYGIYADAQGSGHYAVYGQNTSSSGWAGYFTGRGHFGSTLTVGTEDVLGQLHVHSAASAAQLYISPGSATSGDTSSIFFAEDDDGTFGMYWLYDGDNNEMQLFGKSSLTTFGPLVRIERNTGNMALGTVFATDHRLSVDGKIACEEVRVELSGAWPDYVFDDDYDRPSLAELKSYIRDNGHLPGIPGAEAIARDGLEVGQMQSRMMEKIEELTLYILDLNADMEHLRAENQELKQLVNQIQANRE